MMLRPSVAIRRIFASRHHRQARRSTPHHARRMAARWVPFDQATRIALLAGLTALSLSFAPSALADGLIWYRVTEPATAPAASPKPEISAAAGAVQSLPRASAVTALLGSQANRYAPLIAEIAGQYNIDPMLMHAVIHVESAYNEHALSNKGAIGLMQLMPATAERFGKTALYQPRDNLQAGAAYLQELLRHFGGRLNLALAGYNAGEDAVSRNGNTVPPYPETRAYVQQVLAYYARLKAGNAPDAWPAAKTNTVAVRAASTGSSGWDDLGKLGQLLSGGAHSASTSIDATPSSLQ